LSEVFITYAAIHLERVQRRRTLKNLITVKWFGPKWPVIYDLKPKTLFIFQVHIGNPNLFLQLKKVNIEKLLFIIDWILIFVFLKLHFLQFFVSLRSGSKQKLSEHLVYLFFASFFPENSVSTIGSVIQVQIIILVDTFVDF
jgi:hypothetical protein